MYTDLYFFDSLGPDFLVFFLSQVAAESDMALLCSAISCESDFCFTSRWTI